MKLVTYEAGETQRIGALLADGTMLDLEKANRCRTGKQQPAFASMLALIEAGSPGLARATALTLDPPDDAVIERSGVKLLAPLPLPAQIRCFSVFEQHARQSARVMMRVMADNSPDPLRALEEFQSSGRFDIPPVFYERPLYYKGNRFSIAGTGSEVVWPDYSDLIDYELEIAAIIGRGGKDIGIDDAASHIFGYSVFNDLTARDEQSREMAAPLGPAKGKDFDGGNVLGPCIVTADEMTEIGGLRMTAKVNGEIWTDAVCEGMAHSFSDMLVYVSRSESIHPGEIFLSGCVGGGSGMEQQRYLARGDRVELEIEGIGKIGNKIV